MPDRSYGAELPTTPPRTRHVLRPLALRGSVQGLVLAQRFPANDLAAYGTALNALIRLLEPEMPGLERTLFIQLASAGEGNSTRIRELGGSLDDFGLGIHPESDPPRTWTRADFEKITLSEKVAPLFLEIMRARPRRGAPEAVRSRFFGTGGYAEAHTPPGVDFYAEATALFKPGITNRTARMFPYHAPVLRRLAAEAATPERLQQWMCGAHLYLREAVEEDGVLLLFRGSSTELLHRALRTNETPDSAVEFLV